MAILLEVLAKIDERQVKRETDRLVDVLETKGQVAGKNFGEGLLTGISDVAPKVEKSLNAVKKATDDLQKSEGALTVAQNAATNATNRATVAHNAYLKAKKDENISAEELFAVMTRNKAAFDAETAAVQAAKNASVRRVTAYREEGRARQAAIREVREYNDAVMDGVLGARRAIAADEARLKQAMRFGDQIGENISKIANAIVPSSGIGMAALPIVDAFIQLIPVAASAAQAVAVLPAILGAAGVGFGTLAVATNGFGDALKNMGDPEKFAEALAKLSPNAQQAALSIKALMPEFKALETASQNALFAGWDQQINQLTSGFLPQIQTATTGIAGAFNQIGTNISQELLSGEGKLAIDTFLQNTTTAFQALAPAAAPFVNALDTLLAEGSSKLPAMAVGIQNMANQFSNFINTAAENGNLSQWMDAGLHTLNELSGVMGHFVEKFMELAPVGDQVLPTIVDALNKTSDFLVEIIRTSSNTGTIFGTWRDVLTTINPILQAINWTMDKISISVGDTKTSFLEMTSVVHLLADIINSIKWFFDPNVRNEAQRNATDKLNAERAKKGLGPISGTSTDDFGFLGNSDGTYTYGGTDGHTGGLPGLNNPRTNKYNDFFTSRGINVPDAPGIPDGGFPLPFGAASGAGAGAATFGGVGGTAWSPVKNPFASKSGSSGGSSGSNSAKLNAIRAGLDPSSYAVGPADMLSAYPGQHVEDVLEQQHTVEDKRHKLEEARKDVLALEKDNTHSAEELNDAKWKEQEAQWAYQKSQADLIEKQRGTTKSLQDGMDKLGAALDPDFGLSKGLAGLAENLTKFIGNILFMPTAMKLQQTVNADPIKGGFGALGILGAQNLAAGNSPLLGNPVPGGTGYENAYSQPGLGGLLSAAAGTGTPTPSGWTGAPAGSQATPGTGAPGTGGPQGAVAPGRFTGGSYGLPGNTNTGGYGNPTNAFPPWVQELGKAFNVKPSTYPGHQATDRGGEPGYAPNPNRENRGIDWSGTPQDMQRFADYLKSVAPNDPALEQIIWQNPNTGARVGLGGAGNPTTGYYPDTGDGSYAEHMNHVHTRQSGPIPLPASAGGSNFPFSGGPPGITPSPPGPGGMFGPANLAPPGGPQEIPFGMGGGGAPGMPGESPLLGGGGMIGGGAQQPFTAPHTIGGGLIGGAQQGPTPIGGIGGNEHRGAGGGGIGIQPGGLADQALGIASMGLDALAPGAGQAAQIGIKEGSRAIQYAGQVAGIATQGLMDTFLPTGGSELASNSWFTRILGGLSGATPAIPNSAGGKGAQPGQGGDQPPLTPEQSLAQHMGNGQGSPGPGNQMTNNFYTNQDAEGVKLGRAVNSLATQAYLPTGKP